MPRSEMMRFSRSNFCRSQEDARREEEISYLQLLRLPGCDPDPVLPPNLPEVRPRQAVSFAQDSGRPLDTVVEDEDAQHDPPHEEGPLERVGKKVEAGVVDGQVLNQRETQALMDKKSFCSETDQETTDNFAEEAQSKQQAGQRGPCPWSLIVCLY